MAEVIELDIRAKSQQLQAELDKAIKRVNELKQQSAVVPVGADINAIKLKLQLAKQEVEGLKGSLKEVRIGEKAAADLEKYRSGLRFVNQQSIQVSSNTFSLRKEVEGFANSSQNAANAQKNLANSITDTSRRGVDLKAVLSTALGFSAAGAATAAVIGIKNALSDSIQSAREFGVEIAKINSTLPDGVRVTKQQEQALLELGDAYGKTGTEQAAGFFEIISNGIEDTAVAYDILKASNDAALAGITNIDSAARVVTTTFNAYAQQGTTAREITDSLVVATQLSGIKFEALAESLGRVTGLAANSNVSIGELTGTLAFLNKNSLTTEQAITGVRGILNAIIKPSEEAVQISRRLGIAFNSAALESKGLVNFLADVSKATGNNSTTIARLFGDINAINAVVAIAKGGFDSYRDSVDKASNSSGAAAKAAGELKKSLDFTLDRQEAAIKNLGTALSDSLRPAITVAAELLTGLTQAIGSAFKTAAPQDFNTQIDRTTKIIEALQAKDYFRLQNLGIQTSVLTTSQLNSLLDQQIAKRDLLLSKAKQEESARAKANAKPTGPDGSTVPPADDATEKEKQNRIRLQSELLAIDEKAFFDRQSLAIEFEAAEAARKGEAYLAQEEIDLQRNRLAIESAYQVELAKNKAITDANAQAIADKVAFNKKITALDLAEQKRNVDFSKRSLELTRASTQAELDIAASAVNLGAALAKDGDKTVFLASKAVGIAQAIVSTQVAAAKALALDPTGALSARVTAAGYLNVATIAATAIKGFADGGIIGQANGATSGGDNRLATVRDGELILNASQQKNLFDAISSGSLGGGTVVVQIDGREIARAVRNQVEQGFRLQA